MDKKLLEGVSLISTKFGLTNGQMLKHLFLQNLRTKCEPVVFLGFLCLRFVGFSTVLNSFLGVLVNFLKKGRLCW